MNGVVGGVVNGDGAGIVVRPSRAADLPAIRSIYAHHVLTGLASFEETPPGLAEMTARRAAVLARGHPYLVVAGAGTVLGYACAGPWRTRPAYRFAVEDTIYLAPGATGRGLGPRLLAALLAECAAQGLRQMVAVIGDSAHRPSIVLHERAGFVRVGTLRDIGFKFGRWVDSVILQRPLGPGGGTLPDGVPPPI